MIKQLSHRLSQNIVICQCLAEQLFTEAEGLIFSYYYNESGLVTTVIQFEKIRYVRRW